jgi:lipopolysaccharide transport system ATP-binding protein
MDLFQSTSSRRARRRQPGGSFGPSSDAVEHSIQLHEVSKSFRVYPRPVDKMLDAFGINRLMFWRKQYYDDVHVLQNVNLDVRRGERVGIIGRNGAGKSTMLKIICGRMGPSTGSVSVNGKVQALLEMGTGFHPEFTGRQNIQASLVYQGLNGAQIAEAEEEILDFTELDEFIDRPIKTYSAGMYARLAFATATAVRPEILIIDEILGAGDLYFAGKCNERMKRLTEESGATVLFVSHDLNSVQKLCDRVVWVDRGRIHRSGNPNEVIKAYMTKVRAEDELRLKARDLRLRRNETAKFRDQLDLYDPQLFHLVVDEKHPKYKHRVRKVRLLGDGKELATVDVGAALDNDAAHLQYLITGPTLDWGPAHGGKEFYRCYENRNGCYAHAPFQFAVPKTMIGSIKRYAVEIEAQVDGREPVHVERYIGNGYARLGTLSTDASGYQTFRFEFANEALVVPEETAAAAAPEAAEPESEYGDRKAIIRRVELVGREGIEKRIFETGDAMEVRLHFETFEPLEDPVFVFCIYLPDLQCVSQIWVRAMELGTPTIDGTGCVAFHLDPLQLGQAAYIASAAIFADLQDDGLEPNAYHVLNRCIHFQVAQPGGRYPERGLAPHRFTAELRS